MNIRDLLSITGSFFNDTIKETKELFNVWAEIVDNTYKLICNLSEENYIGNVATSYTDPYNIIRFNLVKSGDTFVPERIDLAPFSLDSGIVLDSSIYIYGIGGSYDNSSDSDSTSDFTDWAFSYPNNMGDVIANGINNPTIVLHKDDDFYINNDAKTIVIKASSLENFRYRYIYNASGEITGKEIIGFILNPIVETDTLYKRFGYLVDVKENNLELVRNIMRLFLLGPRYKYVIATLNLALGLPVILEEQEHILSIATSTDSYIITTDKNVYSADINANIRTDIKVGSVLSQLDPIFNNITIYDQGRWWSRFKELYIPSNISNGSPLKIDDRVVNIKNKINNSPIVCNNFFDLQVFHDERDILPITCGMTTEYGEKITSGMLQKDTRINIREYFFSFMWKDSLFYMQIDLDGVSNDNIKLCENILSEGLPLHISPIQELKKDTGSESLSLSDTPSPDTCLFGACTSTRHNIYKVPYGTGVVSDPFTNECRSEELTLADGYYGTYRIGAGNIGDPHAVLGRTCFVSGPMFKVY